MLFSSIFRINDEPATARVNSVQPMTSFNTLYLQARGLTEGGTVTVSTGLGGAVLIAFPIFPTDSWPLECHQLSCCGFCRATRRR